jgi:hypothetical protein
MMMYILVDRQVPLSRVDEMAMFVCAVLSGGCEHPTSRALRECSCGVTSPHHPMSLLKVRQKRIK